MEKQEYLTQKESRKLGEAGWRDLKLLDKYQDTHTNQENFSQAKNKPEQFQTLMAYHKKNITSTPGQHQFMSRPTSLSTNQNATKVLAEQIFSPNSRQNHLSQFSSRTSDFEFRVSEAETESCDYDIKVEPETASGDYDNKVPDLPEVKKDYDIKVEPETESGDYVIKVEPETESGDYDIKVADLPEVKKKSEEEDNWTANLQMDIKKEAVEDGTFVSC